MGVIEIHPRSITKSRGSTPTATRQFVETPDVDVVEVVPALGERHPENAAMTCVSVHRETGYKNDPQQTLYTCKYERVLP